MPHLFPTAVHILADAIRLAPERQAMVCGSDRLSYAELGRCVGAVAAELAALGVRGQRVAIILGNSVDLCIALLAAQAAGAQAAPLNPVYTAHELEPLLKDMEATVIIHDAALGAVLAPLIRQAGIAHGIAIGPAAPGRRLTAGRQSGPVLETLEFPTPQDLALLMYTGGTTGVPKGVDLAHASLAYNVAELNSLVPVRKDTERLLCCMPLCHIYAISVCLLNTLYCRGCLVMLPRYSAQGVVDALVDEQITLLSGGPTMFIGLLADEGFRKLRLPHLLCSYSGSAALAEETLRQWERASGAPVLEGYGQTETAGGVTFNPLHGVRKPGSVGIAVAEAEVQIVDVETGTRIMPPGEAGEIRVRGPQNMRGYRGRARDTAAVLRDGWLYTGDIGYLDADDYLTICDRKKELVIVSGFNVYPREVEEAFFLHPDVLEAAVIGVADPRQGEALKAYVVLRAGSALDADALQRHCRIHLAPYKVPRQMEFLESLPRTSVGKLDKKNLRAQNQP
ncbi:MAG: AMP-binding protein [Burkholderiaceae bacterium]|nr:AMP-binding protein [Burkholderiaceae bacterium]